MNINDFSKFLDDWFQNVDSLGIDYSGMKLDHLGYSVSSNQEYDQEKVTLLEIADLVKEANVSNRRVGVFKFKTPLKYKGQEIEALELIEPKEGETGWTGFEHTEFTTKTNLHDLVTAYPSLPWDKSSIDREDFPRLKIVFSDKTEIKFNNSPILE